MGVYSVFGRTDLAREAFYAKLVLYHVYALLRLMACDGPATKGAAGKSGSAAFAD
jgi:hypothetical protein